MGRRGEREMVARGCLRPGGAAHLAREKGTRGERAAGAVASLSRVAGGHLPAGETPPATQFTQKGDNREQTSPLTLLRRRLHHQSPMRHVWGRVCLFDSKPLTTVRPTHPQKAEERVRKTDSAAQGPWEIRIYRGLEVCDVVCVCMIARNTELTKLTSARGLLV